jgi:BASS family bile acid:Na+ symporter
MALLAAFWGIWDVFSGILLATYWGRKIETHLNNS